MVTERVRDFLIVLFILVFLSPVTLFFVYSRISQSSNPFLCLFRYFSVQCFLLCSFRYFTVQWFNFFMFTRAFHCPGIHLFRCVPIFLKHIEPLFKVGFNGRCEAILVTYCLSRNKSDHWRRLLRVAALQASCNASGC